MSSNSTGISGTTSALIAGSRDRARPRCPHCNGLMRPAVVWFGEALPSQAWQQAMEAAQQADVFCCIGTSSLVEPAASLPRYALASGHLVIQINPEATSHDRLAHHVLRGKAGEILPELLHAVWPGAAEKECERCKTMNRQSAT